MYFLAAEGGEAAHNPIIPAWQEIVVGGIAFIVLCFVLMKFVFPRMEQTFQARVDAIEGGIKRAEAAQAEANQLLEQYRAQLAEARTDAAKIRDDARADAEGIRQDILAKAREESDRIIAAGKEQLAAERATIVRELRTEVGAIAVDLASKIVGESLADEARRKGTVDRFLSGLESTGAR
ncbi:MULTISPECIES: F0F1 ATP synthase subunit B [Micromonospora]|uniref:ATP synthase subunit b n=1 Tax=Micromonospora solifontis TaxID=2487138 RepID=A0ABX9WJ37_9ACTN|nr:MULTISPECIES: F0F1 ATP synthase subunit B [Micromonospora]NES15621.1 F0F1 ATP synthase subunit B [Micromonospora sp. PPF5-17B]NES35874.1 F0F1 ATP synthase subunit B [Micromonospora solifontis]NES56844.1 F0F1 ATP synthase subunit B [Micromonospora sp. PPF5-6]RNM00165.1 F0F1 ATP synthase subunit B [Micromonospora solifontis]